MTPKRLTLMLAVVYLLAAAFSARAASLYTETFSGNTGGWQSPPLSSLIVTNLASSGNPGGCLQGTISGAFIPFDTAFIATGAAASASFIGNYTAADAQLLGFDIQALVGGDQTNINATIKIVLDSGSNRFQSVLNSFITQTAIWYKVRLPLSTAEAGGWTNVVGAYSNYSNLLTNVTRVAVEVPGLSSPAIRIFRLDNFFLDRLPAAVALSSSSTGTDLTLQWDYLRTGLMYQVESSSEVTGTWTLAQTLIATNRNQGVVVTNADTRSFFRLREP